MSGNRSTFRPIALVAASLLLIALAGCGDSGGGGAGGGGTATGGATPVTGNPLNINITSVTTGSPPVVNFKVTDETGAGVSSITAADLRFNIAKLVPGSNGEPASWQNYINRAVNGAVEGTQERSAAGFAFGTLANLGGGNYTYTFATDIASATANPCPAPCTDADGKALNISYQPGLTHRVTIQQGNSAKPKATGVFDFVPSGGGASARDIVLTATNGFEPTMLFMLLFPLIFGGIGLKAIGSAKRAKEIATKGFRGRARILNISATGTRINNVPMMRFDLEITVDGQPPVRASATKLMYPQGGLVGAEIGVIWHPKYPTEAVMEI